MTELQGFMLAVCFGAVVGTFIGNVISIIMLTILDYKDKKHRQ